MRKFIFTLTLRTIHEQLCQTVKIRRLNLRDTIPIVQVPSE